MIDFHFHKPWEQFAEMCRARFRRLHEAAGAGFRVLSEASMRRLVVTRRLGKAVRRNRVKRLLREFFRRHKAVLPRRDLIVMAKKGAAALSYQQVRDELARLLLSALMAHSVPELH